jgi:alpha-beta hydrolase superfamily lysophospholipase
MTWTTDVLGPPYEVETIEMPPDDEGLVVATLVRRRAPEPTRRAVLHVHGFADYFFHTEYAEWWNARGYDFYALDLRKFGRSLRPHQTPNYVADLHEYYADLDLAWWRIVQRDGHDHVVSSAHSTGGLTLALWAHDRRPDAHAAMVLNSPWFDMQGSAWLRSPAARVAINQLGSLNPRRIIPRDVSGIYGRSLHVEHDGEWSYDLDWKPLESRPVYVGWLRAIRTGHARVHHGLAIDVPVLVLSSDRSHNPVEMDEDVHRTDIVLDVHQIRRWASSVGLRVTSVTVPGAMHDVVLSRPEVRAVAYDEIGRWWRAYVDAAPVRASSDEEGDQSRHADHDDEAPQHDRREPAPEGGAEEATEDRPGGDEQGDGPVHVGDEHEHDARDAVHQ